MRTTIVLLPRMLRRGLVWSTWAALLASTLAAMPATADGGTPSRRTPLVEAIEKAMPSVVSISSEKRAASNSRWPFSPEESRRPRVSGMGTGVILDERGFILTNQHVVDRVNDVQVFLSDGSAFPARVLQEDREMDLAVLKIDAGRPLRPIAVGSSADLMIGETVITIGNAVGYENTTSTGIISALGRTVRLADDQVYLNLIQTDAGINPGNSGGPLINIDGEMVGINVATRAGAQGIGFALPIDDVKRIVTELMSTRRLAGTWHGLVTAERLLDGGRRVVVSAVEGGSPAEEAGVRPGDRVVRVNGIEVTNPIDIERGLLDAARGGPATLVVDRGGEPQELPLHVRPMGQQAGAPAIDPAEQVYRVLGIRAVQVAPEYVTPVSPKLRGGLFVQEVQPGSVAERAQLLPGDILVGMLVGSRPLETTRPGDLLYILQQSEAQRSTSLSYFIIRQSAIHQGLFNLAEIHQAGGVHLR